MTHDQVRELLADAVGDVDEVDLVDRAWARGQGMRRRRQVLTATGLVAGGAGAAALVLSLLGGGEPGAVDVGPAVTPPAGEMTLQSADPVGRLVLTPSSIAGVPLAQAGTPAEEVRARKDELADRLQRSGFVERSSPPENAYPGDEARGGCRNVARKSVSMAAGGSRLRKEGTTIMLWGAQLGGSSLEERTVDSSLGADLDFAVDEYLVYGAPTDSLVLPFGLQLGMSVEEAGELLGPGTVAMQAGPTGPLVVQQPSVGDDFRLWFEDDVLTRVHAGPYDCGDLVEPRGELVLGPEAIGDLRLPAPVNDAVAEVQAVFPVDGPSRTETAPGCPGRTRILHGWPGLELVTVTSAEGPVVQSWIAYQQYALPEPAGKALPFGLTFGMSLDQVRDAMPGAVETSDEDGVVLALEGLRAGFRSDDPAVEPVLTYVEGASTVCVG